MYVSVHGCNLQAQQALEQRRAERARMDDLMRHPSQAPAPPKKPILRKGSGAVLRPPVKAVAGSCCSPRPATVPVQGSVAPMQGTTAALGSRSPARAATAGAGSNQQSCMVDGQRREWADSLKQFIAGQREARKPKQVIAAVIENVTRIGVTLLAAAHQQDDVGPDLTCFACLALQDTNLPADDGLSWQELKVAAEAGFEELLRTQEAAAMAAAAAGQQHTPAWRRPGMTRATGGGGSTAEHWAGAPGLEWASSGACSDCPSCNKQPINLLQLSRHGLQAAANHPMQRLANPILGAPDRIQRAAVEPLFQVVACLTLLLRDCTACCSASTIPGGSLHDFAVP